jgi:hypothetical protein
MVLALLAKAMLAPAIKETLEELPLSEKLVAAGTVGPMIVKLLAPLLIVILAPAIIDTLDEVPLRLKFVAEGTNGPEMVILGLVES